MNKQVIQNNIGVFTTANLDNNAHALLVRFITQRSNAFKFLFLHQLGNTLYQTCLIYLIRQFCNDDSFLSGLFIRLDMCLTTDDNASSARMKRFINAVFTLNDTAGWEIRPGNMLHNV